MALIGWIRKLVHRYEPHPMDVQIWHCSELVVVDDQDLILYAGPATIEFEPSGMESPLGLATVIEPKLDDKLELIVLRTSVHAALMQLGQSDGLELFGEDGRERYRTWLINGSAIHLLSTLAQGVLEGSASISRQLKDLYPHGGPPVKPA